MEYQPLKLVFKKYLKNEINKRSIEFYEMIRSRRSIRKFRKSKIDDNIIEFINNNLNYTIRLELLSDIFIMNDYELSFIILQFI